MYDVIIIGAGPSGTAAALDLIDRGARVLLFDKARFPRKKACAGGITPKAMALFPYDIKPLVRRSCTSVKIRTPKGGSFLISEESPLCHMVRRQELDLFSLTRVIEKGGQFKVIKKIQSIEEKKGSVSVRADSQIFSAKYLIGADGANSIVRRIISPFYRFRRLPAVEADIQVEQPLQYKMEFYFPKDFKGYYWIFPRDDHINIGIYSAACRGGLSRKLLAAFAKRRFGTDRLEGVKGYPICVDGVSGRPGKGRVLLAGDAAGFAEGLLGEGIYAALESGQAAARAVLAGLDQGEDAISAYSSDIQSLRTDLRLYRAGAKVLYGFPRLSLALAGIPLFHGRFSRGYAAGEPLGAILKGRRADRPFKIE